MQNSPLEVDDEGFVVRADSTQNDILSHVPKNVLFTKDLHFVCELYQSLIGWHDTSASLELWKDSWQKQKLSGIMSQFLYLNVLINDSETTINI